MVRRLPMLQISDELKQLNSQVTVHIEKRNSSEDCMGCQTEEGRSVVGIATRKGIPIDTYNIRSEFTTDDLVTYGILCLDCILHAQRAGVNVLKNGEIWDATKQGGFFLRSELLD